MRVATFLGELRDRLVGRTDRLTDTGPRCSSTLRLFIVFFVLVFLLYWALGRRTPQNVLLLVASYVFYGAWSRKFLPS